MPIKEKKVKTYRIEVKTWVEIDATSKDHAIDQAREMVSEFKAHDFDYKAKKK